MKKLILKIFGLNLILAGLFFGCFNDSQAGGSIQITYLKTLPSSISLPDEYLDTERYLIYKFLATTIQGEVPENKIRLNFFVDSQWLDGNKISEVNFLKFDSGNWVKVLPIEEVANPKGKSYAVVTNKMGKYWVIIGKTPKSANENIMAIIPPKEESKHSVAQSKSIIQDEKGIESFGRELMEKVKNPVVVKSAMVTSSVFGGLVFTGMSFSVGGPSNLLIMVEELIIGLLNLFFVKKRRKSGYVYNVRNGSPVACARIDLIDENTQKTKATKFTNSEGKYYFLAPPGKYFFNVQKKGFGIISEKEKNGIMEALLDKSDISYRVSLKEKGIVTKNVALTKVGDKAGVGKIKSMFKIILKNILEVAFIVGFVASIIICCFNFSFSTFSIASYYVFIFFVKRIFFRKVEYGTITNKNNQPEPFASIIVIDKKIKKIVARAISNDKGQFYILVNRGEYILDINTRSGTRIRRTIKIKKPEILFKKIVITDSAVSIN